MPIDTQPDYEVGYRKPPTHTQFKKGRSGNPRGRPRVETMPTVSEILFNEADRTVSVRDGNKVVQMRAIQALVRRQVALAAKGNHRAVRSLLEMLCVVETDLRAKRKVGAAAEAKQKEEKEFVERLKERCLRSLDPNRRDAPQRV